jgi:hypothetical protein
MVLPRIEERGGEGATPSGRTKLTSSLKRRKRPIASGPTSITVLAGAADRSRSRMRGRHFRFICRCCRVARPPISTNSISSDAAIGRCSTGCNRDQTPLSRCVGHRSPLSRPSTTAGFYGDAFVVSNGSGERAVGAVAAISTRQERVRDRAAVPTPDTRAGGAARARWAAADPAAEQDRSRFPILIFSPPAALRRAAR